MEINQVLHDQLSHTSFFALENLDKTVGEKTTLITTATKGLCYADEINIITNRRAELMRIATTARKAAFDSRLNKEAMENYTRDVEWAFEQMTLLVPHLDSIHSHFLSFDVPKLVEFDRPEFHGKALLEFMRDWRDKATLCREAGGSNLIERVLLRNNLMMRTVAIDIGKLICGQLSSYLRVLSVSVDKDELARKIHEIMSSILFMRVELKSVLNDMFLLALEYAIVEFDTSAAHDGIFSPYRQTESDALYLIFREVLRFEVIFNFPDTSTTLSDEEYVRVGDNMKSDFGMRLNEVEVKIEELKKEVLQNPDMEIDMKLEGMKELWDDFVLAG